MDPWTRYLYVFRHRHGFEAASRDGQYVQSTSTLEGIEQFIGKHLREEIRPHYSGLRVQGIDRSSHMNFNTQWTLSYTVLRT